MLHEVMGAADEEEEFFQLSGTTAPQRRECKCGPISIILSSPAILGVTFVSLFVLLINLATNNSMISRLAVFPMQHVHLPFDLYRFVFYTCAHRDWSHFLANFSSMLLVGPYVERKLGTKRLAWLMTITAAATGITNAVLFSTGLIGASGLSLLILLLTVAYQCNSHRLAGSHSILLSHLLLLALVVGRDLVGADSGVSRFAHITGAVVGFGWLYLTGGSIE